MKLGRNVSLAIVCMILGIILAWQFQSITQKKALEGLKNKTSEELRDQLLVLQGNYNNLWKQYNKLQEDNKKIEAIKGDTDEQVNYYKQQLQEIKMMSGLLAVKGKGVIVTLSSDNGQNIFDDDILDVLNELRASDAQAISINDERIVAMTEVREAGDYYIVVNGKQISPPYVIKAIADPDNVERAFNMMEGVKERLKEYNIDVKLEKQDNIVISQVSGPVVKTDMLTPVEK